MSFAIVVVVYFDHIVLSHQNIVFGRKIRSKKGALVATKSVERKRAELCWKLFVRGKGLDYVENEIEKNQEKGSK